MSECTVKVTVNHEFTQINLRCNADDPKIKAAVEQAIGQSLPVGPNTLSEGDHTVCWLGPDEWLIKAEAGMADSLTARLEEALEGLPCAINDISGGQLVLRVEGSNVTDVFAKGCTLDFHETQFAPGTCAQSGLAKAGALFIRSESGDVFDVVIRRSFSGYLMDWLAAAGAAYNIEFR